ncbi:C2H2 zinc finger protein [Musa troglodytarum]|uniref:C2H2 zinc finger protein n=1 Tax=Musa troglodytarum TaxID=320322 RepID=A0A9E7FTW4_9LILI|nr:C2H2 zinc finger protein [Musa troglodytarum]
MDQQQPEQQQQQPQTYKHYCRICKKGFGCGRALGGHMRAHGIIDNAMGGQADADGDASCCGGSDWDDKLNGSTDAGTKRMYALRTNPNRLKSCRHGKCSSDEEGDESLLSSPRSEGEDDLVGQKGCAGWSKGKRSRRKKVVLSEEEDLANCLVMLSAARQVFTIGAATETAKAPAFASPPLPSAPRGTFECKACKKVFSSHQALGGHRASHKKVEMVASMSMSIVPFENTTGPLAVAPLKKKSKVHECSICHRVFMSGQALGGHKRCHWITSNSPDPGLKFHPIPDHTNLHRQLTLRPMFEPSSSEPLDLNMPAPVDDIARTRRDIGSSLRLEMPAAIYLRSWIDRGNTSKHRATSSSDKNNENTNVHSKDNNTEMSSVNVDDEADSKVKLAKLSELKDINMGGESSPWLQVGIGSSANEGSEA